MVDGAPALEDKIYLDWFKAHSQASLRRYLASSSASASDLIEFLSPFGVSYHSSLNPVFLAECESLQQLDFARTWLARDGMVPLAWFFSRFPDPLQLRTKIYIPSDMTELVPKAWASRIGTYQFGELPRSERPANYSEYRLRRTKLILLGISSPAYCGLEHLVSLLSDAKARFKRKFGAFPREVSVCLVQKTEPLGTHEESSRHANEVMRAICEGFGTRVNIMDLRDFHSIPSFNGTAILELNERFLCADTSLVQAAVGKGAALLEAPLSRAGKFVRTNLTHGFALREPGQWSYAPSRKSQARIERALSSTANRQFPWHHWSERESVERLEPSRLTGFPRFLRTSSLLYWALPNAVSGTVDVVYLGADKFEIHGWCADPLTDRAPAEIHVFRNLRRIVGKTERFARADVQRNLKRKFSESFKPGFIFQLPRLNLRSPSPNDVFSVYCLFPSGFAALLTEFKLDVKQGSTTTLPRRVTRYGTYLPFRLTGSGLEIGTGTLRALEYNLSTNNKQYLAWLDLAQEEKGEMTLVGWGADLERSCPAEAVAIYGGGEHALVFPMNFRRPDIGAVLGRSESCGFTAKVPWTRPRVFVLFDSHLALELSVPAKSGSA